MALGATIYTFDIELADSDRAVYETLNLRVAQHPSETPDYLITRVLAYCLEFSEGIAFSKGLSDPDEPAICVRDLTGALQVWVDIGLPEPERVHRASKAAPRVAVYTHKDAAQWRCASRSKIHRAELEALRSSVRVCLASCRARAPHEISLARSEGGSISRLGAHTSDRARAATHITRRSC